jgi:hypothetical protein
MRGGTSPRERTAHDGSSALAFLYSPLAGALGPGDLWAKRRVCPTGYSSNLWHTRVVAQLKKLEEIRGRQTRNPQKAV